MKKFLAVLFLTLFFVCPVVAQQAPNTYVVVTFTAPTTRSDGTLFCSFVGQQYCPYNQMVANAFEPSVEILKYTLYYAECSSFPPYTPPITKLDFTSVTGYTSIDLNIKHDIILPTDIPALQSSTYTLNNLKANTCYYFGATATDIFNQESNMSSIVSKQTATIPEPSAPSFFQAPNTGRR